MIDIPFLNVCKLRFLYDLMFCLRIIDFHVVNYILDVK